MDLNQKQRYFDDLLQESIVEWVSLPISTIAASPATFIEFLGINLLISKGFSYICER